ncbi:aminodeoxychorismate lyase [Corynebacterium sp. sy017]|uniref:aminodeoxychorismate lyase n=1 Tax=unclassified Corynebacterium TaxID=2624378 RepID=UPI00118587D8|nr:MULTISPECIES: aminodeoxychorismate lyase [unclassified Corynebacterium]MBP3089213.1 aminodeoxychorismate lyase [Corynebacterium sp. sy017]TSD91080.1 aminodeoxychorismate lyase [Corynebacterium sp. SY003]
MAADHTVPGAHREHGEHKHKPAEPIIIAIEPFGGSIRNHRPQLPLIYWDDAAVTRGDGIFETFLLHNGKLCNFERHSARFQSSAALLDLPEPHLADWVRATELAAQQWQEQWLRRKASGADNRTQCPDARCVWTYTRGRESTGQPSAWLSLTEVSSTITQQRKHGVKAMTAARGYRMSATEEETTMPSWLAVGAKTLNYAANMAALRYAKNHGFDDVIYVEGEKILEGATSNVVLVRGDKIRTPIPGGDILAGTAQAALFDYASTRGWRCKAKDLYLEDLYRADSVWLLSSVRMGVRVRKINDMKLARPDNEQDIQSLIVSALSQP